MTRVLLSLALLLCVLCACGSGSDEPDDGVANRTLLVYMVATNSLGDNRSDMRDLEEMEKVVSTGKTAKCRLLVYHAAADGSTPVLKEVYRDGTTAAWRTLVDYGRAPSGTSLTAERMRQVIADAKRLAPAPSYGLVLWSHASGWLPAVKSRGARRVLTPGAITQAFGEDDGYEMPIEVLAEALPDGGFDFICADVCYMGAIEVAYELRTKCRQLMASASEVPNGGMPYDVALPYLCRDVASVEGACQASYNYYNSLTGAARSYTGVVVDCERLDRLADVCREIYAAKRSDPDAATLQCYYLPSRSYFFDFEQYYSAISPTLALSGSLHSALGEAVTYRCATPQIFLRLSIDSEHYSGLSTYVPGTSTEATDLYYASLAWSRAITK
ncbi:MAG: hypothetical protein IJ835_02625 [Muribaculaceae bacterium]|nr:hypothetical protein [Muribaculaceae bacterium]